MLNLIATTTYATIFATGLSRQMAAIYREANYDMGGRELLAAMGRTDAALLELKKTAQRGIRKPQAMQ
jgi:hypothetical protein